MDSSHGKPRWVNYTPSTPLHNRVRSCFSHNIVGPIHIGIELLAALGSIQAPREASSAEDRLRFHFAICWNGVIVQETGLTGIAFLRENDLNTNQFGLVAQLI